MPYGLNENWSGAFGLPGSDGRITASALIDNELYVAGEFSFIGGTRMTHVAMWDGNEWHPLGSLLDNGIEGDVNAIAIDGDRVYFGGSFQMVDHQPMKNIACWNRSSHTWSSLGQGIGGLSQSAVFSLVVHEGDLYAGGRFVVAGTTVAVNIARWSGEGWHRVGTGMNDYVVSMISDDTSLYASGYFTIAGDKPIRGLARFSYERQEWESVGLSMTLSRRIGPMAIDENYLYVGGTFSTLSTSGGTIEALNVARMARATGEWSALGGGVGKDVETDLPPEALVVEAIAVRGEDLFVGGTIGTLPDIPGVATHGVVKWDRTNERWSALPVVSQLSGRTFLSTGVVRGSAPVGSAADFSDYRPRSAGYSVSTIVPFPDGSLVIGGEFEYAGPFDVTPPGQAGSGQIYLDPAAVSASNICRLANNDTEWMQVGGQGVDNDILALAEDSTSIYVGGKFLRAGDELAFHIAQYDKVSGLWKNMGSGTEGGDGNVRAIAVDGENVYVGGSFTRAGGISTGGLALWNSRTATWSAVGSEEFDTIRALAHNGSILAAVGSEGLAIWDGLAWEALPEQPDGEFTSLHIEGDSIFVGGQFSRVGNVQASNLISWNRTTRRWSPIGSGVNGRVNALAAWGQYLYIGGDFTEANGRPSNDLASWDMHAHLWDRPLEGIHPLVDGDTSVIYALHAARYGIYLAGTFTISATSPLTNRALNIALWDGKTYNALANGLLKRLNRAAVYALSSDSTNLHVGGMFHYAGGKSADRFASWAFPVSRDTGAFRSERSERSSGSIPTLLLERYRRMFGRSIEYSGEFSNPTTSTGSDHSSNNPDDQYWDDRFSPQLSPPGTNDEIFALAADSSNNIFVGGVFTNVIGIPVHGIAMWNGRDWETLDDGTAEGINGFVFSLLLDGDNLYVGGQFTKAGSVDATNIAVWNRTRREWSGLGEGLTSGSSAAAYVSDMTLYNGELYVGGSFARAGSSSANNIARWDGTGWHPLSSGVDGTINALETLDDRLYAGGSFGTAGGIISTGIATWNGSEWSSTGGGVEGTVNDLTTFRDMLLIGGDFRRTARIIRDSGSTITAENLLFWSPDIDSYVRVTEQSEKLEEVRSLFVDQDRIYVGGLFDFAPDISLSSQKAGPPRIRNVGFNLQYSGPGDIDDYPFDRYTPWDDLEVGTDGPVNAIVRSGSYLYVAGSFSLAASLNAANIARWYPPTSRFSTLSSNAVLGPLSAMDIYHGKIYAAGTFSQVEDPRNNLDGESQLAPLGISGWKPVNGKIRGSAFAVNAAEEEIIVGGSMITADGKISVNIVEWDAATGTWKALTPGSGIADQDEFTWVNAIVSDDRYIYVGGLFGVVDTFETPNVTRFDRETRTWERLGEGLDGQVWGLALDDQNVLYAAGEFTHSGTRSVQHVARFDGTDWQPVGGGIDGDLRAIAVGDGSVVVGGTFASTVDGPANNIARFDRTTNRWEPMGEGLTGDFLQSVTALEWYRGRFYAGGYFSRSGSLPLNNIARWNGSQWDALGSGVDHAVWDILPDRNDIYVSGVFKNAGEKPSPYVALWHDPTLTVDQGRHISNTPLLNRIGPNPFASATRIHYSLPANMNIRLVILDLNGATVAELSKGKMEAGEHTVEWHPDRSIPAGVYYCRLSADGEVFTEKIVRY